MKQNKTMVRILIVAISIILLVIGIVLKDNTGIYRKAIFICLECIGIG
ncbi:MAG: hypothetical protein J6B81_00360 [Spirochaetaceae bacterium]|nr:hypothetical protein [Spirochaetaceae bacterium]